VIGLVILAATPSPSPSPAPQADPSLGSPGFVGFLFTFLLAAAVIALVWSMSRQLRKVDRNARLAAAAEEGAADEPADDEPTGGSADDEAAADEPSADPGADATDGPTPSDDEGRP
jgi:hypothetical protein